MIACQNEKNRISYTAVPPKATYAAFRKESGMRFANATKRAEDLEEAVERVCRYKRMSDLFIMVSFPL